MQRGNNVILGTGWVSELNPRKGVLTFDNGGHDERVLMLASKLYIFERRLGARQCLSDVLTEGFNCSASQILLTYLLAKKSDERLLD